MKEKLIALTRNTYGNSYEIDSIHSHNFTSDLFATIELYCIRFSYDTSRNNKKERKVYLTPSAGYENLEEEFWNWLGDYNNKYPYRKLSNVKILDSFIYETYNIIL